MQFFSLVFEDLLNSNQKIVVGRFLAKSSEDLASLFQLEKRKTPPQGYWDGKTGEVVIHIVLDRKHCIQSPKDLQEVVRKLQVAWS